MRRSSPLPSSRIIAAAAGVMLLGVMLIGVPAFSANSPKVVIRMGHVGAPISPQQGAADIFIELVNQKTKGSVDIKVYGASAIGDERELVEGMVLGTIDGAIVSSGLYGGYYPVMSVFEIPFLFRDRSHANAVNNGQIGSEILSTLSEKAKITAVALWEHGFRQVTNNVRPIRTPADIAGLKIRSPEVPVYSTALRALGAIPVPMPFSELYVALDRGVVDGQHNPLLHVVRQRFYEVQKYLSMLDFAYTPNIVAFSNKTWARLSPDQQKAIIEAAKEAGVLWSQKAGEEEARLVEDLKGKMQVLDRNQVDKAAFQKIVIEKAFPEYRKQFGDLVDRIVEAGK